MSMKIFNTIINSGTNYQNSLLDKRRVRYLNILYIISICSAETYSVIYSLIDFKLLLPLILFSNIFVLLCAIGILLNRINKTVVSQHLFCILIIGITSITTFAQIGTVANSHFYFLLFAMAPILVWRLKQIIPILFYFSISTFLFIYAQFIWNPLHNLIIFPSEYAKLVSAFTVLGTFISLLAALWINYIQIEENEKKLEIQSTNLEEMIEELRVHQADIIKQKAVVEKLNNTLSEKNKSLVELIATKDKFFSIIAHDLRSPFNSILGFSNLLYKNFNDYSDTQIRTFVENIHKSTRQTFQLLENLLEWSRSQSGAMEFKPEMYNVDALIAETIEMACIVAKNKQITIYKNIDTSLYAYVDKDMFNVIIRNLLSNAIKYTYKSGIVSINISKKENIVFITISDNGIGINSDWIENIFNITEKHAIHGTENEKGTGIGLLLCKDFVEKHGGSIWVESEIGKGSSFTLTIPSQI